MRLQNFNEIYGVICKKEVTGGAFGVTFTHEEFLGGHEY